MALDRTQSYASRNASAVDDMKTVVATIDHQQEKYANILPSSVRWADFRNAFLIAVQQNSRLLEADRNSLWLALQKAASDGLKPDGREGALVIFGDDAEDEDGNPVQSAARGKKKVVWMPMIAGLIKLVRNTGNVANLRAKLIYRGERVIISDEDGKESYKHIREIDERSEIDDSPANIIGAYAVIAYRDGFWEMEAMTARQIARVRATSRSKRGPWLTWADEMSKKTVLRRLIKRLEKSPEMRRLDAAIEHDDTLTIDGSGAEDIAAIQDEFTEERQKAPATEPAKNIPENIPERSSKTVTSGPTTDKEPISRPEEITSQPAVEAGPSGETGRVELWATDEFGEPAGGPWEPAAFSKWFATRLFVTRNPAALIKHNADALKDAREADPAAEAEIVDAIMRHDKRRREDEAAAAARAQPSKAGRIPVKGPTTAPGYQDRCRAEIEALRTEADIVDWIAVNEPTYKNRATEIPIHHAIKRRRDAIAPKDPSPDDIFPGDIPLATEGGQ